MGEDYSKFLSSLNGQNQFDEVEDTDNGLCLANIYIPEEILLQILSYIDPKEILNYSLVCHKWNRLIKSYTLWTTVYKRKYNRKPKKLPWYLYYCLLSTNLFDTNLLLNGNGQEKFNNWEIKENDADMWSIEDPPLGADPLPTDVPEFNTKTSCFVTSYGPCYKVQLIKLGCSKLFQFILDSYKPHIYISEWTASRSDCGCIYRLGCKFVGKKLSSRTFSEPYIEHRVTREGGHWKKIEITIEEYPEGLERFMFEHEGCDTQFWEGHYGSKMAGGVVKLLFDSIEQLPTDKYGNEIPKKFSEVNFITNASSVKEQSLKQAQDYYRQHPSLSYIY